MKRYLTLSPEVVEKTVGLVTDINPFDCNKCPCRDSFFCEKNKWLDCARTIHKWLFDEVDDYSFYTTTNEIYQEGYDNGYEDADNSSYDEGYNVGYEDGWNNGRRNLVKQIEKKAGIIRKERDRK